MELERTQALEKRGLADCLLHFAPFCWAGEGVMQREGKESASALKGVSREWGEGLRGLERP